MINYQTILCWHISILFGIGGRVGIVVVGEDTGGMLNPGMVVLGGFGCFGVVDPDIQYSAGEFGKT